jgi:hypothetical protein
VVASSAETSFTAIIFTTHTQPPQNKKKEDGYHFKFTTAGEEWGGEKSQPYIR